MNDPFAITIPTFNTTFEGVSTAGTGSVPYVAPLADAVEGIRAALASKPAARDTTAGPKLVSLIESLRQLGL
jgi:hypothetical protein